MNTTDSAIDGASTPEERAEQPVEGPRGTWLERNWRLLLVLVLAAIPGLRMGAWIISGTHVQYADYWVFMAELIEPDGSVHWGALTEFQAQHLLSVPLLMYLINTWLFGGSNITLGLILVVIVAAQLAVLWYWIRRLGQMPFAVRGILLVLASTLLFSPFGAWNYLRAMSGAAWLTANLVVMLAVFLAARDRTAAAVAMAVLATITYGTGVMAWPAVIVVVLLRRRPLLEVGGAVAVGLVVVATYMKVRSSQVWTGTIRSVDLDEVVLATARIVGWPAGLHEDVMLAVGSASLLVLVIMVPLAILRCREQATPFIGLAVFAALASAQIAYGRLEAILSGRIQPSRYTSLGALTLVAVAGLGVALISTIERRDRRMGVMAVAAVPLALIAASTPFRGAALAEDYLDRDARLLHLADAQRLKVSRQHGWFPLIEQPDIDDRLERLGHHPFDGRWNADCGWLGRRFEGPIEVTEARATSTLKPSLPDAILLESRVPHDRSDIGCVIVTDDRDLVIGAGRAQVGHDGDQDGQTALVAYAPADSEPTRILVHRPSDDRWSEVLVGADEGS